MTLCPTNPQIRELEDSLDYLQDIEGLELIDCPVFERKVYRDALSLGRGVVECENEKAATEIYALVAAIEELAHG